VGLVVNPIAGLGGPAGLKGTDSPDAAERALRMGIEPTSWLKAAEAVRQLSDLPLYWMSARWDMGERSLLEAGVSPDEVVPVPAEPGPTTREDTVRAVRLMLSRDIDLLMFAGGDGTARDVMEAVGESVPVVGIPAGVKMFSGVFGFSPRDAGLLAREYLLGRASLIRADVVDADENSYKAGRVSIAYCGAMLVPRAEGLLQPTKQIVNSSVEAVRGAARYVVEELIGEDDIVVLGPGSTVSEVARELGVSKTPLGVDVLLPSGEVLRDVSAPQLRSLLESSPNPVRVILSPLGGSGILIGRGNQQIIPALERCGREELIVVASPEKIRGLRELRMDLDEPLRSKFAGFIRVVTGYREEEVIRLK